MTIMCRICTRYLKDISNRSYHPLFLPQVSTIIKHTFGLFGRDFFDGVFPGQHLEYYIGLFEWKEMVGRLRIQQLHRELFLTKNKQDSVV